MRFSQNNISNMELKHSREMLLYSIPGYSVHSSRTEQVWNRFPSDFPEREISADPVFPLRQMESRQRDLEYCEKIRKSVWQRRK